MTGGKMLPSEDRKLLWEEKSRQIYVGGKGPKDWTVYLFTDLFLATEDVSEKKHKVRSLIVFDSNTAVTMDDSKGPGKFYHTSIIIMKNEY